MLFERTVYLGIDPAAGRRKSALAALDQDMHVVRLERGTLPGLMATLSGMQPQAAAITTPQGVNMGLLQRAHIRYLYQLNPEGTQYSRWRTAEFDLLRRGLRIRPAPQSGEQPSAVFQTGYKFYARLRELGYEAFDCGQERSGRVYLEVPELASFAALLGVRPYRGPSLEGRLQRQLALYMAGLDLPNPMMVLEEITRHKLLTGALDLDDLLEPSMLAALTAAYTACLTVEAPRRLSQVGVPEDGLITLPSEKLAETYSPGA